MHVSRRFSSPTWTPSRNDDVNKAQLNVTKSISRALMRFQVTSFNWFAMKIWYQIS